jgi:hypothetical protein
LLDEFSQTGFLRHKGKKNMAHDDVAAAKFLPLLLVFALVVRQPIAMIVARLGENGACKILIIQGNRERTV